MDVLVADDDIVSRRLLEISLSHSGFHVQLAANGAEALRVLEQPDSPRLAVLDWMMPGIDGVDVCREIRKQAAEPYVYIILLTAKGGQNEIVQGLEAGADDYIIKPFDIHELKARLRAGKRILELQKQLMSAREQLLVQATHDSLTGLPNRKLILETLEKELVRSKRVGTPLSITMADIDHFKQVNDSHGHLAGDAVLREAARRMKSSVRAYDTVGRYGGEEFLIVSPSCGIAQARDLAERLRRSISQAAFEIPGGTLTVTLSLGVTFASAEAMQSTELLRLADEALYAAKGAGRNRVEVDSSVATQAPF